MKKLSWRYFLAILIIASLVAPTAAPVRAAGSSKAQPARIAPATGVAQSWDSLVTAAKKEGIVSVYALWRPQTRVALTEAFKAKYGINVEFTAFSRGAELLAKIQTEQRSGLFLADVFGAGGGTSLTIMKPAGVLGVIEPMLVLPEVIDEKNWSTGRVPLVDNDKTVMAMISSLQRNIVYNTDMIRKGEITDYADLLKPQYKGKITMNDPTLTGSGGDVMTHLAINIWDLARAKEYLAQLVGPQQVVIQRDNRLHIEEVAKGKYPIGLAPNPDNLANFLKLGAHLEVVIFKQGVRVTAAAGTLSVPVKQPHLNAAKLFVNWLLSKEGQTVFSKAFGNPSLRKDVTTEGFNPIFLPQPGEKVFADSEEFLVRQAEGAEYG